MLDFNDAEQQRSGDRIPPCFAKLKGHIRPGGVNGPLPGDEGLLKASNSSDALMLDFEFTVMCGPHAGRKLFTNMTVAGGSVNEKGESKGWNVSKSTLRAMVESALGVQPNDMSDVARQRRMFQCFRQLDGIEFAARIDIEPGKPKSDGSGVYDDKNIIKTVVTPDKPEWQAIMAGQDVPLPAAQGAKPASGPAAQPTWGGGQPAQAQQQAQAWGGQQASPQTGSQPRQSPPTAPTWATGGGAPAAQGGKPASGPAWLNG